MISRTLSSSMLLVGLTFAVPSAQGAPPEPPSAPVTVQNEAANPVPVTLQAGTSIGVDGDVNVGGSVSVEPGEDAIPVVVEGTVLVDSNGEPIRRAGSVVVDCRTNGCSGSLRIITGYTVPDGKIFVIDAITVQDIVVGADPTRFGILTIDSQPILVGRMEDVGQSSLVFGGDLHLGNQRYASDTGLGVRVPSGSDVSVRVETSGGSFNASYWELEFDVFGRLFDE